MSLSGWEGGRNCWHWIITLAERAVLASMSRGLSVPRTDYRAWFMTCRGVVTIARIHGMPSGVYACLRSQSDSWRYLGFESWSYRVVHRCVSVFCRVWLVPRIDGFSGGGLMHGDVLSYVWSLRYRPLFREISLFPRLGFELGQIGGSDRGMYNELWGWVKVIVRNILLIVLNVSEDYC